MSDETVQPYVADAPNDQLAALRECVDLNNEKARLKERLKAIEARLTAIEPECLNLLIELGDEDHPGNMRIAGSTVYLHPTLYARPKDGDRERTAQALVAAGLGYMVKPDFNINTLSAWVREVKAKGEAASTEELVMLAAIEDTLEITEAWDVRTRKAPKR